MKLYTEEQIRDVFEQTTLMGRLTADLFIETLNAMSYTEGTPAIKVLDDLVVDGDALVNRMNTWLDKIYHTYPRKQVKMVTQAPVFIEDVTADLGDWVRDVRTIRDAVREAL